MSDNTDRFQLWTYEEVRDYQAIWQTSGDYVVTDEDDYRDVNYVVDLAMGYPEVVASDTTEPEDATFTRTFAWVVPTLNKLDRSIQHWIDNCRDQVGKKRRLSEKYGRLYSKWREAEERLQAIRDLPFPLRNPDGEEQYADTVKLILESHFLGEEE